MECRLVTKEEGRRWWVGRGGEDHEEEIWMSIDPPCFKKGRQSEPRKAANDNKNNNKTHPLSDIVAGFQPHGPNRKDKEEGGW